jgi:hypothetical protein
VRFAVEDPDKCQWQAAQAGLPVLWPAQDTAWGRSVELADPDGRSAVLAWMNRLGTPTRGRRRGISRSPHTL